MNNDKDLPLPPLKEDFDFWNCFDTEIQILRLKFARDEIHQDFLAGRVSRWVCGKALAGFNRQIYELENLLARSDYQPFDLSFCTSAPVVPVVPAAPVVPVVPAAPKKRRKFIKQEESFF